MGIAYETDEKSCDSKNISKSNAAYVSEKDGRGNLFNKSGNYGRKCGGIRAGYVDCEILSKANDSL